ncbi:hypothetical protein RSAG8_13942, partial [Rhizoctonia solani AG-8 WAC10335]
MNSDSDSGTGKSDVSVAK